LVITSDRILVIRKWVKYPSFRKNVESKRQMLEREKQVKTLEELLRASNHICTIRNSEITKVELKKRFLRGKSIKIITTYMSFTYTLEGLNKQKKM